MSNTSASLRRLFRGGAAFGALTLAMGSAWAQQTPAAPQTPPPAGQVDQTQPPEAAQPGERVVITGSRIARDNFSSASPIQVITSEAAVLEGLVDTAELLQGSTLATGSVQFNNQFGGFVIEGGPGINSVSLRGLGAQRSLVLLNGKRPGPAGVRGQVGSFDLNVIPDSIISRVEILKDGASSIYGSDAVAGVVNIITRSSVDRPELTAQANVTEDGGGNTYQINGAWGADFGTGSIMLAAEYEMRENLQNRDRKFSSCTQDLIYDPVTGQRIDRSDRSTLANTSLGGCRTVQNNLVVNLLNQAQIWIPSPNGVQQGPIPGYRLRVNTTWANSGAPYFEEWFNNDLYQDADLLAAVDRISLYGKTDFNFSGINWTTEGLFTRREYEGNGWRQFFPNVGGTAWYNANPTGWQSPFGAGSINQIVTMWNSDDQVDIDYFFVSTGLQGGFGDSGYLSRFGWDVNASYSKSDGTYSGNEILNRYSGDAFVTAPDGLYYAPEYNPFDPNFLAGKPSAAVYDLLTEISTGTTTYDQTVVSGVVSGDVFDLPAGPLGLAVGAEWRNFSIDDTPGQGSQDGIYWGTSSADPTRGEDTVSEYFAEINVPLLKGLPFINELNLDASTRAFEYDSYGSDSVWKAGLNWQISPSVRIRGTKGTSYRAPALYELFLNNQTAFLGQALIDPCIRWADSQNENIQANCAAAGIPGNYAGNGASATIIQGGGFGVLDAETSEATTLGIVFTPTFLDLSLAIEYFDIVIEDQVTTLGAGTILGGCYGAQTYPNGFCDLFSRNPGNAAIDPFMITSVTDTFLNANQQATHGIDITLRYEHEFNWGDLSVDLEATHTMEDVVLLFDPNISSGFANNDFNGTFGDPEWVASSQVSLKRGDFTYSWFTDYVHETDNSPFANETFAYNGRTGRRIITTDPYLTHDVSVRWAGDQLTLTGGIANVFDAQPPSVSTGAGQRLGNTPLVGSQYDYRGRTFFLRAGYKF